MEKVKLKAVILTKEITKIFKKFGLTQDHAKISAKALINAELVGAYGHGLSRLKMYCDCLLYTSPSPRDRIASRMPSSA